jgi:phosphoglycolate phosphatase
MIKGVIFDLDGTLVDTIEDLTEAMNHGLRMLGCPERTLDECAQMVGSGLKNFVSQALPAQRQELGDQLYTLMTSHYGQHLLDKTKPYEGIRQTVRQMRLQGIQLAVLTNKNQIPAERIIQALFDPMTFSPVVGNTENRKVKPDPQSTLEIISRWGRDRSEVVYVGDSDVDILTAAAAGIRCVACLWGYRSRQQLEEAGATMFIERPGQLPALLAEL